MALSPTPSQVGSDYWDPPCRVCKAIDDEPNVLCELCNGAYHLACLDNIKPPLPRSPEDDEWFCRGCIKRGVPETILERAGRSHLTTAALYIIPLVNRFSFSIYLCGRDSTAYFLVKWLGQERWDVSWENAKTLDTAWCRCAFGMKMQFASVHLIAFEFLSATSNVYTHL